MVNIFIAYYLKDKLSIFNMMWKNKVISNDERCLLSFLLLHIIPTTVQNFSAKKTNFMINFLAHKIL